MQPFCAWVLGKERVALGWGVDDKISLDDSNAPGKTLVANGIMLESSEVIFPPTSPPSTAGPKVSPGGTTKLSRTDLRTHTVLGGSRGAAWEKHPKGRKRK